MSKEIHRGIENDYLLQQLAELFETIVWKGCKRDRYPNPTNKGRQRDIKWRRSIKQPAVREAPDREKPEQHEKPVALDDQEVLEWQGCDIDEQHSTNQRVQG